MHFLLALALIAFTQSTDATGFHNPPYGGDPTLASNGIDVCSPCQYDEEKDQRTWQSPTFCDTEEERENNRSCQLCSGEDDCTGGVHMGRCPGTSCEDPIVNMTVEQWHSLTLAVNARDHGAIAAAIAGSAFQTTTEQGREALVFYGCGNEVVAFFMLPEDSPIHATP